MKIKQGFFVLFFILTMMVCSPVWGHNMWLNPGDHFPQVGSTVDIGIGWGHKYPADRVHQEVKEDRVEEIRAVDPDGKAVALTQASAALYKLKVEKAGAYLVIARIKPGFFTMTAEGRKWGDKKSVENGIKCTNFHIQAKTVIIAGGADTNLSGAAGQPLELIPLTNPETFKKGGPFAVQVLFNGKPAAGVSLRGTYAGFEDKDVAPHKPAEKGHGHPKHFPAQGVTDEQGKAELTLERSGYWMISLSHKPPYADTETCDEYMYNEAFTFQVRSF